MKIIGYVEWIGDMDEMIAKNNEIQEERKSFPDSYPMNISDGYFTQTGRSETLMYEGTEEQFTNLAARWLPEARWKFVLALDTYKVAEAYEKLNK
ncbi:MAG: hypothetical protein V3S97_02090 [Candidatus Bathyarchaeia archaeon]